jgi:phosphate uptake regulator
MEGRKLQLSGGSTYMVSLPKWWVTRAGLGPGDTLFVATLPDGGISVRSAPGNRAPSRPRVFKVTANETRDHLFRKLLAAYVAGQGTIVLHFPSSSAVSVRGVVRQFCRRVMGPEVIDESATTLTIQDLSDRSDLSSEKCLRRMHLVVRAMVQDAVQALHTGRPSLAQEVIQREPEVHRLFWMLVKQCQLAADRPSGGSGEPSLATLQGQRFAAKLLERIGDHALRIAVAYPALARSKAVERSIGRELESAGAAALLLLDDAFRALMTQDIDLANQTIDHQLPLQVKLEDITRRVSERKPDQLLALGKVIDSLGRTAAYATDLAEQAINLAILADAEAADPIEEPAALDRSPSFLSGPRPVERRTGESRTQPTSPPLDRMPSPYGRGSPTGIAHSGAPARAMARGLAGASANADANSEVGSLG